MKNKKVEYGQSGTIESSAEFGMRSAEWGGRRGLTSAATCLTLALALAVALSGCMSVPHTTIAGKLNGSPFLIEAPKDGDMTGFDLTAGSNGVLRVHIDHLAVKMDPDVISQTGAAQAGIIAATGAVASNITAAAVAAALKGQ
jgi:hypothetical protein